MFCCSRQRLPTPPPASKKGYNVVDVDRRLVLLLVHNARRLHARQCCTSAVGAKARGLYAGMNAINRWKLLLQRLKAINVRGGCGIMTVCLRQGCCLRVCVRTMCLRQWNCLCVYVRTTCLQQWSCLRVYVLVIAIISIQNNAVSPFCSGW